MKIFIFVLFLFVVTRLFAVAPSPYTEAVLFTVKPTLTVPGGTPGGYGALTIFDESGPGGFSSTSYTMNQEATSQSTAWLRPGKKYDAKFNGLVNGWTGSGHVYAGNYVNITAPHGYTLYIDGVPKDLLNYTFDFDASYGPYYSYTSATYSLELRPNASAQPLSAGGFSGIDLGQSITWEAGLGALRTGRSAGRIIFKEKDLTASPASRDLLYYAPPAHNSQITPIYDGALAQRLRQISAPQTVVDILEDASGGYWLKYYEPSQATLTGSVYTFGAYTAWRTIRVQAPAANQLQITENEGSVSRVSLLVLTSGSVSSGTYVWTLKEGNGTTWLRTTTHTSTNNGNGTRDEVVIVRTGDVGGTPVTKVKYTYKTFVTNWEQLWKSIADPDATQLTTTYDYHLTLSAYGNYLKLKSVTSPTGGWVSYSYYDDWNRRGQLQVETRPYVDTAFQTASSSVGNSITHDYVADFTGRYRIESSAENRTTNVPTGMSTTVPTLYQSRNAVTFTVYQTDAFSASGVYQRTTSEIIDPVSGFYSDFGGQPYTLKRPDQSQDSFAYYLGTYSGTTFTTASGGTYFRTNVWHGSTNSSGATALNSYGPTGFVKNVATVYLVPNKSTMDVIIRNPAGLVVRTEAWIYTGGTNFSLMNYEDFTYDGAGRLTKRVVKNGATTDYSYTNGQLEYAVDVAGTRTDFTYDLLGRTKTSVKDEVAAYGSLYAKQVDLTTTYTYDGANHVTQIDTSGGALSLASSATYDLAGRLASSTAPGGYVTGFAYSSGGKIVTTTMPGTLATKITETHLDGKPKTVGGTGVVAELYTYGIETGTGRGIRQATFGGLGAMYTNSYTDWFGRLVQETKPGWGGTAVNRFWYYNTAGQLWKFNQPLMANTLYQYDTLGQQVAQGLDINGNNILDPASDDRITSQDTSIQSWDGGTTWWAYAQNLIYATSNNGSPAWTGRSITSMNPGAGVLAQSVTYDRFGNSTAYTTSVNRSAKQVYVDITSPDSSTTAHQVAYNGLMVSALDTTGITMKYGYDELGRQNTSVDPRTDTGTTTTVYMPGSSLIASVKDPANVTQAAYTYDTTGRVKEVTNALGKVAHYSYNTRNQKTREWGNTVYPAEYTYDTVGRQVVMTTYAKSTATFTGTNWPTTPNNPQSTT